MSGPAGPKSMSTGADSHVGESGPAGPERGAAPAAIIPSAAATRSCPTSRGNETILIAEDEPAVRGFVERVLSRAGYRVFATANGHEALATASTLPELDLLFTDMVMPGMSGRELAAQLSATDPTVRVVFASGYSADALDYGVGNDGRSPFLAKPFTADGLLACVREALDRST